jgi:hypothetical protein
MRLVFVAALAGLAAWLARSPRARELARRSLSRLPSPLGSGLQRAMTQIESAAEQAERAGPGARRRTATIQVQELPDGSWVGDATWGGRTFHEGATAAEPVVRRLAAHLSALPESDRPDRATLTRVPRAGAREEGEHDLAGLLA